MTSPNSNSIPFYPSAGFLLLLLMSNLMMGVIGTGQTACPLTNSAFGTSYGVDGAIQDGDSNLMYSFGTNVVKSWSSCQQACQSWPNCGGTLYRPRNSEVGACAYWSWTVGAGCKIYGCSACRSFTSFSAPQYLSPLSYGQRHCSGGGPRWKQCVGGVKGDPHYTGGDRSNFDFTGVPGKFYCLVSDPKVHINVLYDGRFDAWGLNKNKPLTWIRKVGILWGKHTIVLEARQGPEWKYQNGYMAKILVNDREVDLRREGEEASFEQGRIQIVWDAARQRSGDDDIDVYHITIADTLKMIAKIRPEVPHLRTNEDGVVHFTLEFPTLDHSDNIHGVLGQTYRSDHKDRLSKFEMWFSDLLQAHVVKGDNADGFLDGKPENYESSDLLKDDCSFARFDRFGNEKGDRNQDDKHFRKMLR